MDGLKSSKEFLLMPKSEIISTNTFEEVQDISISQGIIETSSIPNFQTLTSVGAIFGSYESVRTEPVEGHSILI